jgi:hypothetical protein
MTPQMQSILQNARIAELHAQANELAVLVRPSPVIEISRHRTGHRRLLLLLAYERRRSARLIAELAK